MTSKSKPTQCFVYITLPGQTSAVTAGRFELATDKNSTPVGRFVYGKQYLALQSVRKDETSPSVLAMLGALPTLKI